MGKAEHLKDKSTILFRYVAEQKHVKQTDIFVEQSLFLPPRFFGVFFRHILSICLFVCQHVCLFAVWYCIHKVFCACAFDFESGNEGMNRPRTSHSEHRWWVQLCLEIEQIHSSAVPTPELGVTEYHVLTLKLLQRAGTLTRGESTVHILITVILSKLTACNR